jgi:3',5'-cyclic-AMP phosphodiesterase
MRITQFHSEPLTTIPFMNAGRGGGPRFQDELPVHHAQVDRLPDGVSAIVVTADLQGRECKADVDGVPGRLFGEVLPWMLIEEVFPYLGLEDPSRVATFLAGDFYTVPLLDKRGGTGDISSVWQSFNDCFAWGVGVAGNHDLFGKSWRPTPGFFSNMHYLDGDVLEVAGLRIGGLGGIIGNPAKPQRREENAYFRALESLLRPELDVLIMHEGPDGLALDQQGNSKIRDLLERHPPHLVIRGHKHWAEPFTQLPGGLQILNVDARVVILTE